MANLTDLDRALKRTFGDARNAALPTCIAMTDPKGAEDVAALLDALPVGAAMILRHYGVDGRGELAARLVGLCHRRGIRLLVAGDPGLALAINADGVHLPEWMVRRGAVSALLQRRPNWLVTAAAHGLAAMRRAETVGADAVLLSPVFATASHRERAPLGPLRFARLCRAGRVPAYGLGGITAVTVRRLADSGAVGIAGISVFCGRRGGGNARNNS